MPTSHLIRMAAALALSFAADQPAVAATFATIYRFTGGTDGANPAGQLIAIDQTLYGAAGAGGALGFGSIFQLDPLTGQLSVIYSFKGGAADGIDPNGSLFFRGGALFGTTFEGGLSGCSTTAGTCGTVFKIDIATKSETVLHRFTNHGIDGGLPSSNLVDVQGLLYGTTVEGSGPIVEGCNSGCGTVFQLRAGGGREKVLYTFTGNGPDGSYPLGHLLYSHGQLYGTTMLSGGEGCNIGGAVFKIDAVTGAETTLYSFPGCANGGPSGGVIMANGMLYGTTQGSPPSNGTIFKVDPSSGAFTLLYSFKGGLDGAGPSGKLVYAGGALYGTTSGGKVSAPGTIFKFDLARGVETVIHNFTTFADGFNPTAGLIKVGERLYGTTPLGGLAGATPCCGNGTIFVITP